MGAKAGRRRMKILLLRLDAPLMSFGGVLVDQRGSTRECPSSSMLTGLIGNALGYRHGDHPKLNALQDRLRFAARRDRSGRRLTDYQTVDLGQQFMHGGWTTRGAPEGREGGSAKRGTHIRYRDYLVDAVYTVALRLDPADLEPTLESVGRALDRPARPLFIGRKTCLPATRLVLNFVEATSLTEALATCPSIGTRSDSDVEFTAWWPAGEDDEPEGIEMPVHDQRDWANQIHAGRRFIRTGQLEYAGGLE